MSSVAVLGAGSWGTTFAKVLADAGCDVTIWARRSEVAREIHETRRNSGYLRSINLPANLDATDSLEKALEGASQVYVAVPSQQLRDTIAIAAPLMEPDCLVISLMKGVEALTGLRMSEVLHQAGGIDPARIAVLSGPNLALEIAKEQPTAAVASSLDKQTASAVASASTNAYFKTFINDDVVGTEFGGVLKNLIAVAVGIADGVGYGENTKASIITRGLAEITDFAVAFGAQPQTMSGLAGLGDLIATCESPLSRNNSAGRLLGQGHSFTDVVRSMNQTAEGLAAVAPVLALAKSKGVSMPIVTQVGQVLDGSRDPRELAPHFATDSNTPEGE
ncbi:MAG: NAD(P)H-dependent glycerol-3-phosphate dehydrogenase [Microbacteriaceae bacterium]|jgi:glycerol-3-phosphate dehydrogenase (NAD(P)+)